MNNNNQTLYLIHGIYFYEASLPGIGYKPGIGEAVIMRHGNCYSLFSGVIAPLLNSTPDKNEYGGNLTDYFGESFLTDVKISTNKLSFKKTYKDSKNILKYSFKKEGDVWLGSYKGKNIKGLAKCFLQKIDESFFADENGNKPE